MVYSTVSPTLQVRRWWNSKRATTVWNSRRCQKEKHGCRHRVFHTTSSQFPQPHLQDALEENVTLNSPSLVLLARFCVLWMTNLTKLNHISTAPRRKQICPCSQQPTVDTTQRPLIRQLDKPKAWYTHTGISTALESERQLYSAAVAWNNLEDIVLRQSQHHKGLVLCGVAEGPQNSQHQEPCRTEVIRRYSEGETEWLFNRYRVSKWDGEKLLDVDSGESRKIL